METTNKFSARLFGPGFPDGGTEAEASWEGEKLVLIALSRQFTLSSLSFEAVSLSGFNDSQWHFQFHRDQEQFSCFIECSQEQAFLQGAPGSFCKVIETVKKKMR